MIDTATGDRSTADYGGYFHTAANGDVYILWNKKTACENDVLDSGIYLSKASAPKAAPVMLTNESGPLFGCKTRLGAAPSDTIDCYWSKSDTQIMYGTHTL